MQRLIPLRRLEAHVRTVAAVIGGIIAIAIPTGYFAAAYVGEGNERSYEARLSASALAKYAYVQGPAWRSDTARLADAIGFVEAPDESIRQVVYDDKNDLVTIVGTRNAGPAVSGRADIVVGAAIIGHVEIESSLRDVLIRTGIVGALSLLLGLASYLAVHHLPITALRRTLEQLRLAHARLEEQVAETRSAYEKLQEQHRITEETASQLSYALERVEFASRTKSEFLANMSHELRTPLNAIIGFSEIIKDETFGPSHASYRGYAADIHESGGHLLQIINDILDMSKIESGKLDLHESELDLGEVVVGCRRLMRERAIEAGVTLLYDPPQEPLPALSADPTKLKQILLNLLSNSVKFTPRGGTVTLALFMADEHRLAIAVSDTGIGMSAEDMALALQPFRQIDNSHTRKYQGTGLGLPLAKALTELHGGELRVASELGSGTTVTVLLPTPVVEARRLSA